MCGATEIESAYSRYAECLSRIMGVEVEDVSIKATTTRSWALPDGKKAYRPMR